MSLIAQDLKHIKAIVEEVTNPRFNAIDNRFEQIESRLDAHSSRFDQVDEKIENLAIASHRQFETLSRDLDKVKDDMAVVKDFVKDHSFRITKLEHKSA